MKLITACAETTFRVKGLKIVKFRFLRNPVYKTVEIKICRTP